jgi:hypothetical protein
MHLLLAGHGRQDVPRRRSAGFAETERTAAVVNRSKLRAWDTVR